MSRSQDVHLEQLALRGMQQDIILPDEALEADFEGQRIELRRDRLRARTLDDQTNPAFPVNHVEHLIERDIVESNAEASVLQANEGSALGREVVGVRIE